MSPIELQTAGRDDLVSVARDNGAGVQVVDKLEHSGAQRFDGPDDVRKAVFGND
ncbi:DUF2795 domain-containing protein [Streptomyces sp. NBC_01171]|uniref:DUF2795 domain-containing protein n=1 Tax=Streptomyces sp. NBC_01171 TaxID=2903757 RepID=UPI0038697566|nr:DUF2795 domain-containing protein [Streptomyces sp. NBC_01171]